MVPAGLSSRSLTAPNAECSLSMAVAREAEWQLPPLMQSSAGLGEMQARGDTSRGPNEA